MLDHHAKPQSNWTKADLLAECAYLRRINAEQRSAMRELKLDLQRARDEKTFALEVARRPDTALISAQRIAEAASSLIQGAIHVHNRTKTSQDTEIDSGRILRSPF